MVNIFLDFGFRFRGRPTGGDAVYQIFRNQVFRFLNLFMRRRPPQNRLDFLNNFGRYAGSLGDMRLLSQVLAQQFARGINRSVVIFIY